MILTRLLPHATLKGEDMGKNLNGLELGKGIRQRKDGLYEIRYIDKDGKRRSKYCKELPSESVPEPQKYILDDWFEEWLNTYKVNLKPTTAHIYRQEYVKLSRIIGKSYISELNPVMLQHAINKLSGMQAPAIAAKLMRQCLQTATNLRFIETNPALNIVTRRNDNREPRVLTQEEVQKLYLASEGNVLARSVLTVGLNTGMRIGEIVGLEWKNVDFDRKTIFVKKTIERVGSALVLVEPKTKTSKRKVPMKDSVVEALKAMKERKDEISLKYKPKEGFEDLIFVSKFNNPYYESSIRELLNRLSEKSDVEPFYPHAMRHTFATNCIRNGMNPKLVQMILGHSSINVTMDIYCNLNYEDVEQAFNGVKWGT